MAVTVKIEDTINSKTSYAQKFIVSMKRLKEFRTVKDYFRRKKEYQRQ